MFDKLICAISIICLPVVLVLVLVLKDSLRTYFKSLSLSWSFWVRSLSLSLSLGGQVQEVLVLVLVLGGQVLVLVLVLGGQILVNIPDFYSASSSPLPLIGATDYSIDTVSDLTRRSATYYVINKVYPVACIF